MVEFGIPCFALAHRDSDNPLEMARSVVLGEFGNMGRCLLLFRTRQLAEDAARFLSHDIVIEVGNLAFLTLIVDAAIGLGCGRAAVDYLRTLDGVACHFHELNEMIATLRSLPK